MLRKRLSTQQAACTLLAPDCWDCCASGSSVMFDSGRERREDAVEADTEGDLPAVLGPLLVAGLAMLLVVVAKG